MSEFSDAFNRFLGGHNDAPSVNAQQMIPGLTGGSRGWTEEDYRRALAMGLNAAPPEMTPGLANVNIQRGYVNPYIASLASAAAGNGPSQAQNALREGTATTVATQFGSAAAPSVGGAQQAALLANAQNNAAGAMQSGARQAAQLRAQEMSDARQQLGQALSQQQGVNLQSAGLITEREKANQQAAIGAGGINAQVGEQNRGGIANIWHQALSSDIRAKEDITPLESFQSTLSNAQGSALGVPQSTNPFDYHNYMSPPEQGPAPAATKSDDGGFLGGLFSDERSKERIRSLEGALAESRRTADTIAGTNVQYPTLGLSGQPPTARFANIGNAETLMARPYRSDASGELSLMTPQGSRQALGPVAPYEYRYKPEFAAATGNDTSPRAGIMAQDLERSPNPALRSAVIDTPIGKAIEPRRALSANLALSAGLDKRLRNIEGALSQPTAYPNLQR